MTAVLTELSENKRRASSLVSLRLSANSLVRPKRKTHPSAGTENPSHSKR
jgi:hypothetical protein